MQIDKPFPKLNKESKLEDIEATMDYVYKLCLEYAEQTRSQKEKNNLLSFEFYELWLIFFDNWSKWSGNINRHIRARIEKYQDGNEILLFQKYCYLYQYWWIMFHLVTKHFTNYRREKITELEDKLKSQIEVIKKRIASNEIIDRFQQKDFNYLENIEKMN